MKSNHWKCLTILGTFLLPDLASAHILPAGIPHDLQNGFAHPFFGLDHLLAMFAIGLWASQQRGRAVWMIPATFIAAMILGGALGLTGALWPYVEIGIAFSVLVLGVFIARATRFNLSLSVGLIVFFALCHGYAHGHEMPGSTRALSFSFGFISATLLLHGLGWASGIYFQKQPRALRFAGGAIALCSVYFFLN
ncbi:MAG: HupE/UreJ family protein [Verrucomicrobiota bacterium]|nr:HupE/UreJ family protein [Verrucomicrobiota bacterium]